MKRIIAIANQKGGVGKTTTTVNLSACLAEAGKRVLVIDMDPQGNTTSGFGLEKEGTENTVYDVLIGECDLKDAIRTTAVKKLDIVTSNIDLTGAEIELLNVEEKEYILRKEAETIESKYDYVVIDCPPSLNMLTVNALTTADTVLIPILMYTIDLVKNRLNEDLMVEGVVFTMYDSRTNLSAQVVENVRDNLEYNIYNTIIPRNVRLAEAPSYGMPITVYDPKSAGAESYRKLAKEVIKNKSMDRR